MGDENVIQPVDPAFKVKLNEALEKQSLRLFLDAIDLIAGSRVQHENIPQLWASLDPVEGLEELPEIFLNWLAGLDFQSEGQRSSHKGIETQPDSQNKTDVAQARDLGAEFGQLVASHCSSVSDFMRLEESTEFRGFTGVYPFKEIIFSPEAAPLAEAARVIATHARHFFDPIEEQTEEPVYVQQAWLKGWITSQLCPWILEKLERELGPDRSPRFYDEESSGFWKHIPDFLSQTITLDDPASFPDGQNPAVIPKLLLSLPQRLFDRFVQDLPSEIPELSESGDEEAYLNLWDVLTALPIKGEAVTLESFKQNAPRDSLISSRLEAFRTLADVPKVKLDVVSEVFFNFHVSWPAIRHFAKDGVSLMAGELFTVLRLENRANALSGRITALRRRNFGRLPLDPFAATQFSATLQDVVQLKEIDLALFLVGDQDPSMVLGYELGVASTEIIPRSKEAEIADSAPRSAIFGLAIEKARDEGLFRLSEALLGFYIITETLRSSETDSIDWFMAGQELIKSDRGASQMLKDCVAMAYELALEFSEEKKFDRYQLKYFIDKFETHKLSIDAASIFKLVHADRLVDAERGFSGAITPELQKLIPETLYHQFVEIEYQFLHLKSLGRNERRTSDFTPIVVSHFKIIEKVLGRAFEIASSIPGFVEQVGRQGSRGNPRIADVVSAFRKRRGFSKQLDADLMNADLKLGQPDFPLDWIDDFRSLRNRASHGSSIHSEEYESVRSRFLNSGIEILIRGVPVHALS